jgi:hypothetical protein
MRQPMQQIGAHAHILIPIERFNQPFTLRAQHVPGIQFDPLAARDIVRMQIGVAIRAPELIARPVPVIAQVAALKRGSMKPERPDGVERRHRKNAAGSDVHDYPRLYA